MTSNTVIVHDNFNSNLSELRIRERNPNPVLIYGSESLENSAICTKRNGFIFMLSERKEREARAAEGGWTVVVHHKGRKKTADSESGIVVGSVTQAAVEHKAEKKKHKEVALNFYRFQKKEAQRNEIMMLQSKFEEDKKRLQQLRATRKFRPY